LTPGRPVDARNAVARAEKTTCGLCPQPAERGGLRFFSTLFYSA